MLVQDQDRINAVMTFVLEDSTEKVTEKLSGRYIPCEGYFDVEVKEERRTCKQKLFGKIRVLSANQFTLQINSSSGTCGGMEDDGSEQTWARQ